ncbi:MAG: TIGR00289 family protein [Candidatus Diapherotrites archaeon]|uniref:TIGR00289 family protein n=2 Tax=Candidatus Iainarchaeum sp. TaxID=3101447 RepID=A0A8T4LDM2_9ARCH|nr:TIGR00289 family protein [Candidatus Diapherotrites archaeon]
MRFVSLFSGGKDSTYALYWALREGHQLASLLTIRSSYAESYMYHLPNIHLTEVAAEAMGFPLVVAETSAGKEAELQVLEDSLADLKESQGIEAVVSGAFASRYQKERVDRICEKLGLESLAPLWGRDGEDLLNDMLAAGFKFMLVAVAAQGLDEKWLGRLIDEKAVSDLKALHEKYQVSLVGEGGEFESLVVDCPLFRKKIEVVSAEKKWDGCRGELAIKETRLAPK